MLELSGKHASPDDEDDTIFVVSYVWSVMLFPNDKTKRTAFFNSSIASPLTKILDDPGLMDDMSTIDIKTAVWLGNYGGNDPLLMVNKGKHDHDGIKAAYILLLPLVANHKYGLQIGKTTAYRALNEWCTRHRERGASERHDRGI